ncbi:MAG: hypothetical protein KAI70_08125, partial [Candidatus Omnitrophica bacterium]|nr:hypothetical protein [Candidatus Omnitrophota bacterium]
DNSHKCVNFGWFQDIKSKPYEKKSKKSKKHGLRLFEKYYLTDQRAVKPAVEMKNAENELIGFDE